MSGITEARLLLNSALEEFAGIATLLREAEEAANGGYNDEAAACVDSALAFIADTCRGLERVHEKAGRWATTVEGGA
jgi:hypothetical protein